MLSKILFLAFTFQVTICAGQSKFYVFVGQGKSNNRNVTDYNLELELRNKFIGSFEYGLGLSLHNMKSYNNNTWYWQSFNGTIEDSTTKRWEELVSLSAPLSIRYNVLNLNTVYVSLGLGPEYLVKYHSKVTYVERSPAQIEEEAEGSVKDAFPPIQLAQGAQIDFAWRRFMLSVYWYGTVSISEEVSEEGLNDFRSKMPRYSQTYGYSFYNGYSSSLGYKLSFRIL